MKITLKRDGFTLLEVLISLFILAVALLGMGLMQVNAITTNKTSNQMAQGTLIGGQRLEQMKAQAFDQITTSTGISGGNPDTAAITDPSFPADQKTTLGGVTYYQVWNVTGTDPRQITAYVLWRDRLGFWHRVSLKTSRSSL